MKNYRMVQLKIFRVQSSIGKVYLGQEFECLKWFSVRAFSSIAQYTVQGGVKLERKPEKFNNIHNLHIVVEHKN